MNEARDQIVTQLIRLYLLPSGAPCAELLEGIGLSFQTIAFAAMYDGVETTRAEMKILRGAISACNAMIETDRWNPIQAPALDVAFGASERLSATLSKKAVTRAIKKVFKE
jgi:hypothetical protein